MSLLFADVVVVVGGVAGVVDDEAVDGCGAAAFVVVFGSGGGSREPSSVCSSVFRLTPCFLSDSSLSCLILWSAAGPGRILWPDVVVEGRVGRGCSCG